MGEDFLVPFLAEVIGTPPVRGRAEVMSFGGEKKAA
jgi:hypothetical protein